MKITLENYDSKASVEVKREDLNVGEVFEELIVPVLLAVGFDKKIIDECLGGE